MKIIRFKQNGTERLGIIDQEGQIRDVGTILPDLTSATIGGREWFNLLKVGQADHFPVVEAFDPQTLLPCVGNVGKLVCLGLNDKTHAEQLGMKGDIKPLLFLKPQSAITSAYGPVVRPRNARKMDWETELLVVIGQRCKYVKKDDALSMVAGYAIHNDLSDRFWQTDQKGGLTALTSGKSFDTFAPMGPYLVTADEVADPDALAVKLWVNGELRQDFNTRDYIFKVRDTVAYCSQFFTLYPGDAISMGSGPGNAENYGDKYLAAGDLVEGEIAGLGKQSFKILSEE